MPRAIVAPHVRFVDLTHITSAWTTEPPNRSRSSGKTGRIGFSELYATPTALRDVFQRTDDQAPRSCARRYAAIAGPSGLGFEIVG